jgi:hypothetical protein
MDVVAAAWIQVDREISTPYGGSNDPTTLNV